MINRSPVLAALLATTLASSYLQAQPFFFLAIQNLCRITLQGVLMLRQTCDHLVDSLQQHLQIRRPGDIQRVKWLALRYRPDEQAAGSKHPFYLPDCQSLGSQGRE